MWNFIMFIFLGFLLVGALQNTYELLLLNKQYNKDSRQKKTQSCDV